MQQSNKLYVVFKENKNYDEWKECYISCNLQILAVCNNPQRALKILEDELKFCKKRGLQKEECLLYVEVFNQYNQVAKKEKKVFNIFQFKKMVEALI